MAIQRSGPTPNFHEYICNYLLIPHANPPSPQLLTLVSPGQQLNWVEIPSFQRGISWDIENVKDLLQSKSILLGNAILSQFNVQSGQFTKLPSNQSVYLVLVDGLQRFAVGTAILSVLHDLVLSGSPGRPGDAVHFGALAARVAPMSAFYLHNNAELLAHPRQAVRDQYRALRTAIATHCLEELDKGSAAQVALDIVPLFITRQVALDIYFNFNRVELLSTFIGINTVRVDLGPVDLLRASIIERATMAAWPQADLEAIENDITETLTEDQKPKQDFMPFVNAALKAIDAGKGNRLFASWNSTLHKQDVDQLLYFIDDFEAASASNAYLKEIRDCGRLPISTVFAHYYLDFLHGLKVKPPFFSGNSGADVELHAYLIVCYRLVIDGTIGRTTDNLEHLVTGITALTLSQLADQISTNYLGRTISSNLDAQWLETQLSSIDQKRAPRVFNAMLLPARSLLGNAFVPIAFGRSATMFHVDHLIPDSLLDANAPGGMEGQTLRNFAPLPTNQNKAAKATSCSAKLAVGNIYDMYCHGAAHPIHPYCLWLLTTAGHGAALDIQSNLERNSSPDVGSERIDKITKELLFRI